MGQVTDEPLTRIIKTSQFFKSVKFNKNRIGLFEDVPMVGSHESSHPVSNSIATRIACLGLAGL